MTNYKLDKVETFFMMPQQELIHISSTIVKDVAIHGGDVSGMVTPFVEKMLEEKVKKLCGK
jgi:pantetheine-phosphate adenylyltransferase